MHFSYFPFLATLFAVGVEALLPRSLLASRQINFGVCTTTCQPFVTLYDLCLSQGMSQACICTTAATTSLQTCINCVTTVSTSAVVASDADTAVDTFSTYCAGVDVPSVTVKAGGLVSVSAATATGSAALPSLTFATATATATQKASSASTSSTSSKTGGSAAIPGSVGASSRNMLPKVGIINVVGTMILGLMLVL